MVFGRYWNFTTCMCRRAKNSNFPRLSELTKQLGCNGFYLRSYDYYGILMEANANGEIFISGEIEGSEEDKKHFYEQQVDRRGKQKFYLLQMQEEINEAMKPPSSEEYQEKERRLQDLDRLQELEESRDLKFEVY
mgnify:CR=1 FL=1